MACFPEETILAYVEGETGAIETARVRDHLLLCPSCRQSAERYRRLEQALARPIISEPPERLLPQVLNRLYPALPRITSIAAMIAASLVFLITWIYIYFDFSGSSLVQALRLAGDDASGSLAGAIKAISTVYHGAQAVQKAGAALLRILLSAPLGAALAAVILLAVSGLLATFLLRPWLKKARLPRP
ncbi:MAG: zf-HC2 domain-containing protein [Candidatus Aminicenantes bacterium]|nr:zf-HC2 domain-containing protein [Candidatus Aminicenantes bacterium]